MHILISVIEIILPVLYFSTIWAYARSFFSGVKTAESLKTPLLYSTVILHFLYIILRTTEYDHPPITSVFEILSLIAFTIAVVYTFIEFKTKNTLHRLLHSHYSLFLSNYFIAVHQREFGNPHALAQ